jgi:integrase
VGGHRDPHGKRIYRRRVIGTVCQYPDADSARKAVAGFLRESCSNPFQRNSLPVTVAKICNHFIQRELGVDNTWRSYSTKKAYEAYLKGWIIPDWGTAPLSEVRTMGVESWLRRLPLAKSSCAKIRGLLSVLFNHACCHEFFDRNPIRLVRQSAKRRGTPGVLTPVEIKLLLSGLRLRERALVLLAASTGLRQSELFGLKWGDVDSAQNTMSVTRSIVCGVGWTLQDRIIPEAGASSSDCLGDARRGRAQAFERGLQLNESRGLEQGPTLRACRPPSIHDDEL